MTTPRPLPKKSATDPPRPRRIVLIAATVVIAVGAVIAAVVVIGGDEPATAASLSQVQASCNDWMNSPSADPESGDQWCSDMFSWMGDHSGGSMMRNPGDSMMDNMMWQNSNEMGDACREWVSDQRSETGDTGLQQCDSMLTWMDGHMSTQGGRWMMKGR